MKYSLKRRQTSMYLRHKVIRALMPRLPGNINWGQRRTWPGTAMILTPGWLAAQENGNFLLVFIVAITLILVGIVAIGFLWQFYVRQQRSKEVETPTAPAPHSDPATALPSETDLSGPASAPPKATSASDEPESIAIPSTRDDNKAKTQPSPAYRQAQSSPAPPPTAGEPSTLPASGQRPGRIHWQIAGMTDRGLKRELNEDNLLMMEAEMTDASPYGLYLVADGMGGHQGGDIASQLIVDTVRQQFIEQPLSYETPFNEWLKSGVIAANEVVLNHQQELTQERKMGSTLVVALVTEGQAHIANVGDSRAYHLTGQEIEQISVDHSLVERLVQLGQLTREEARTHRQRNVIYNTVGDKPDPEVSLYHVLLQPGDRLLLCSDGLSSMAPDEELLTISNNHQNPAAACKALIEAAKAAGGDDNITVIVIEMGAKSS